MLYNTSNATINLAYYNKTIEGDIVNVLVIPVDNAVMIPGHDALSCIEKVSSALELEIAILYFMSNHIESEERRKTQEGKTNRFRNTIYFLQKFRVF